MDSAADGTQRMLNALESGTLIPILRHHASTETVVILRGKIRWIFYDENGNETERTTLDADGWPRMQNVEKDRWHSLECLESWSGLFGCKDGGGDVGGGDNEVVMTRDELGLQKWRELMDFLETNHRRPSKFIPEQRNMRSWCNKKKLINGGEMREDRVALLGLLIKMGEE